MTHEFDLQNLPVEVPGEVEKMHLQRSALPIHRWPDAQVCHAIETHLPYPRTHGPDAVRGKLFLAALHIRRRKADLPPEPPPFHHPAFHGVGPTEHFLRRVQAAIADRLADPGAADALPVHHHRGHGVEAVAQFAGESGQKVHVALPAFSEAPVLAHRHGPDSGLSDLPDKFLRILRRPRQVERQRQEKIHPHPAKDLRLVIQRGQQAARSLLRC